MFSIPNICFLNDITGLPKEILKELCTDLNLPVEGSVNDLAVGIWQRIKDDQDLKRTTLDKCKDKLLCGKISVTWFIPNKKIEGCKEFIIENSGFNPFENIRIPKIQDLTSTPVLICGAEGNEKGEYYLRFMYKSGISRNFYGFDMDLLPKSSISTVYINEREGIVEVRADTRKGREIVAQLEELMSPLLNSSRVSFEQADIIAPFSYDADKIADALNGDLLDIKAKPELLFEDINEEEAQAIVNILTALDSYFREEDVNKLTEELRQTREVFGDDLLSTPFTALILAGLDRVGMGGSGRGLRGKPLYDFFKPFLQHQGGFIRFPINEGGVEQSYTIRVGFATKSVFFVKPATEHVIKYVRQHVIIN